MKKFRNYLFSNGFLKTIICFFIIVLAIQYFYITIPIMALVIFKTTKRKKEKKQNMQQKIIDFQEIDEMNGDEFENYVAYQLLPARGFTSCDVTPYSGDFGVDVVAYKDGIKYAIQCKRFNENVTNKAIQEVFAGKKYYDAGKAMVITNSFYTPGAITLADKIGVELWNRDIIYEIIKEIKNARSDKK